MPTLSVPLPDRSCPVLIEPGALAQLGAVVRDIAPHPRALLIVDRAIDSTHGKSARRSLREAGFETTSATLLAEESAKTLEAVRPLYERMLAARLERSSPVIALGGGIVGDVAGFAAATYLRGVPVVQVPTTLLAMVDASIGGKTGVNHPLPGGPAATGGLGKNLIGAFWQPRAVLADPLVLKTLDPRELRCGLAECIKHAMIADAALLEFIEHHITAILEAEPETLTALVERSATIKARIVAEDERESGCRALLNLGHTFAHAIEAQSQLNLRHGEAVAIGLYAAVNGARSTGRLNDEDADRVLALIERCGLPVRLPAPVPAATLQRAMAHDKKVARDRLRLILPRGLGRAEIVDDVPPDLVINAWRSVGAAPDRSE